VSKRIEGEGPNPGGLCMCGCGLPAPIAPVSRASIGTVRGKPTRFICGHSARKLTPEYVVDPETSCWNWIRAMHRLGYGFTSKGYAHRVYYERLVGPIPEGLEIDHLCRNRACVNPAHMEPVTHQENCRRGLNGELRP
jgi:hypothetical protein